MSHSRLILSIFCLIQILYKINALEIIFALNAGGDTFTDSLGIRYRRDFLTDGVSSDYGKILDIKRVSPQDKILYQTERYATQTFGYKIPMPPNDGEYVLWLKFCEVWFNAARLKVFDVTLNDVAVVQNLDIYSNVGRGVAHDEYVAFQVKQGKIIINGKILPFNNEIRVDFIKTDHDNPKVNAIIVMKGTVDQVPKLPPYEPEKPIDFDDEDEEEDNFKIDSDMSNDDGDEAAEEMRKLRKKEQYEEANRREAEQNKKQSKRKASKSEQVDIDPYENDENSYLLPILVAICAFIPLLYCLCRI